MAKIWNQFVNTLGNIFGISESGKRKLMYDKTGILTDTQITKTLNIIRDNIEKKKDITQQEYNRINDLLNDIISYSNQIGSPTLNHFVMEEKNKMIDQLKDKRNNLEQDLSKYDVKLNMADSLAQDAYNLETPVKTKGSEEYKILEDMKNQTSQELNNYERSIKDAI